MSKHFLSRLSFYFGGLLVMTIGIALSVKSGLGVSPISSIPYTMTVVWGIEMGKATIILHAAFVLMQIILLRRKFEARQLLQIVVGVVFGYFTTWCNALMTVFPDPHQLIVKLALSLSSVVFIALGIFLYLPANLIPLAGEGVMSAMAETFHYPFSNVKIATDSSMVVLSAITCLIALHQLGSVGIGTVVAAILVGSALKLLMKFWGDWRYHV